MSGIFEFSFGFVPLLFSALVCTPCLHTKERTELSGHIIYDGEIIQHSMDRDVIIGEILADEGDEVLFASIIMRFDTSEFQVLYDDAWRRFLQAFVRWQRLEAESSGAELLVFREGLEHMTDDPVAGPLMEAERALFEERRETRELRIRALQQEAGKLGDKIRELLTITDAQSVEIARIESEIESLQNSGESLSEEQEQQLDDMQERQSRIEHEREINQGAIASATGITEKNEHDETTLEWQFASNIGYELNEVRQNVTRLEWEVDHVEGMIETSHMTARDDGRVMALHYAVGDSVPAGEPILDIIPLDSTFYIAAEAEQVGDSGQRLRARATLANREENDGLRLYGTLHVTNAGEEPDGNETSIRIDIADEDQQRIFDWAGDDFAPIPVDISIITGHRSLLAGFFAFIKPVADTQPLESTSP